LLNKAKKDLNKSGHFYLSLAMIAVLFSKIGLSIKIGLETMA
jgi:hypothetical protein